MRYDISYHPDRGRWYLDASWKTLPEPAPALEEVRAGQVPSDVAAFFERAGGLHPVHRTPFEVWYVSRYEDVVTVLKDPRRFSSAGLGWDRVADASDPNNHAKNRRVEIKVYPAEAGGAAPK